MLLLYFVCSVAVLCTVNLTSLPPTITYTDAATGGAACPAEVLHFMDSLGIPVLEGYGLTETSPVITMNSPELGRRQVGSTGQALDGVTVFIVNENGQEVAQGDDGEICCTGPNVMRGYYNNREATEEVISMGPNGERM